MPCVRGWDSATRRDGKRRAGRIGAGDVGHSWRGADGVRDSLWLPTGRGTTSVRTSEPFVGNFTFG